MEFSFDEKLNDFLQILLNCAQKFGVNLYIVGGAVRDKLLGVKVKDFDLIIDGDAVEFSKNFPESIKVLSLHKDFSTVKVEFLNMKFDIASTRLEHYPYSGCLPVVTGVGVPIKEDVSRRDFTVNTLYCRLYLDDSQVKTELIDILNIKDDIFAKKLKVLHKNSYIDDPTRILRGLGLKYRFGFDFDSANIELINNYLSNINRDNLSYDRCLSVLKEILAFNPYPIFEEFLTKNYYRIFTSQILRYDLKKIKNSVDCLNLNPNEQTDFFIQILDDLPCDKYSFSSLLEIYKCFSTYPLSKLAYYFYKTQDENIVKYLNIKDVKLLINGLDLITSGYSQGKIFSEIFDSLLEKKLSNPDKFLTKADELDFVKTVFPII